MKDEIQQERTWAVQRFLNGEKPRINLRFIPVLYQWPFHLLLVGLTFSHGTFHHYAVPTHLS